MQHSTSTGLIPDAEMTRSGLLVCDATPPQSTFASDVVCGLNKSQKEIPSKYLYDQAGSILFDQICTLDEYYPTRTELQILQQYAAELRRLVPSGAQIIELGSGSHQKIDALLQILQAPAAYVAIDISRDFMLQATEHINAVYPSLHVTAISADYTEIFELPHQIRNHSGRCLVFFPGSTIGNFTPAFAAQFLARWSALLNPGDQFLCGVDLVKDRQILHAAYNDSLGITARFNLNLLERMNKELDADFDLGSYAHRAHFNENLSRIEMHIVSTKDQEVTFKGADFKCQLKEGETIHTESSYKYTLASFQSLVEQAGFERTASYLDPQSLFSLNLLTATRASAARHQIQPDHAKRVL
jgi:dimethylhistidine N-methyltransferase